MTTTKFKISRDSVMNGVPSRCSSCAIALELQKLNPCMEPSVYFQYNYTYGYDGWIDKKPHKAMAFREDGSYISPVETVLACVADFDRMVSMSEEDALQEKHKFYERWKDQEFELIQPTNEDFVYP